VKPDHRGGLFWNCEPPPILTRSITPAIEDGIRGMACIEAVVASSHANARWTPLAD
jgi:hypothetical protein